MRQSNSWLIWAMLLAVVVGAPARGDERAPAGLNDGQSALNRQLNDEIHALQELVEEALVWRVQAAEFLRYVSAKQRNESLSSADLAEIYARTELYLALRERLFVHVRRHEHVYAERGPLALGTADGRLVMKKVKIALGAGLVLYDNYAVGVHPYLEDAKLRRLLHTDRPGLEGRLRELTLNYLSLENRKRAAFAIGAYLEEQADPSYRALDRETAYLDTLVRQSAAFASLRKPGFGLPGATVMTVANVLPFIVDDLRELGAMSTFATSRLFGNSIGLVEGRKGHLLDLPPEERRGLAGSLEPLDVLLEKTPFRLTDKFIPGHYGHVAIWTGDEAQLRALGVWDHPVVVPYQGAVRQGRHVVEALRSGVQINTLDQFLNVDDLVVLRHTRLEPERRRQFVLDTFRQIGKEYDFHFDVETDKRIVCSELVYVVFRDVEWPTVRQLGRYTISPDNVAVRGLNRDPFTPVAVYHDGMRIRDRLEETLAALLRADYRTVRGLHPLAFRSARELLRPPADPGLSP